jgi:hypothetical protein
MMVFVAKKHPDETLAGMALILLGWIIYFISPRTPRTP